MGHIVAGPRNVTARVGRKETAVLPVSSPRAGGFRFKIENQRRFERKNLAKMNRTAQKRICKERQPIKGTILCIRPQKRE